MFMGWYSYDLIGFFGYQYYTKETKVLKRELLVFNLLL